jgi:hypothetical protein
MKKAKRQFPILRAIAKAVPIGNAVIELIENHKAAKAIKNGLPIDKAVNVRIENGIPVLPHSYISIAFQFVAVGLIVYACFSDKITIEKALDLIKYFI